MTDERCEHGALPGECVNDGCLYRREVKNALLALAGITTAADDQARAMTDAELGELLTTGRWSTIEVHEAGRRLLSRAVSTP
jgi:hypothetical protein